MTTSSRNLVKMAMEVATRADFDVLTAALRQAGASFERPVGDQAGNLSAISASGDPEHFVLELVTNAQDAVLERQAAAIRLTGESVPYSPRELAAVLGWPGETDTNQSLAQNIQLMFRHSGDKAKPTICIRDAGIGIDPIQVRKTILSLNQAPKNYASYLQGNYGKGGSTLYRDGSGAVLLGRPSPELVAETGCEDNVWLTVVDAVHDNGKVESLDVPRY